MTKSMWFRHDSDFRNSPTAKSLHRRMGDPGFARAIRLQEIMCAKCAPDSPCLELVAPHDLDWLAEELRCDPGEIETTLDIFSELHFIVSTKGDDGVRVISMPDLPLPSFAHVQTAARQPRVSGRFTRAGSDVVTPEVASLAALVYERSGITPNPILVANVLDQFPFDEVKAAWIEFIGDMERSQDVKSGTKSFWEKGGVVSVVSARRERAKEKKHNGDR
jgi:hypothetical protein